MEQYGYFAHGKKVTGSWLKRISQLGSTKFVRRHSLLPVTARRFARKFTISGCARTTSPRASPVMPVETMRLRTGAEMPLVGLGTAHLYREKGRAAVRAAP